MCVAVLGTRTTAWWCLRLRLIHPVVQVGVMGWDRAQMIGKHGMRRGRTSQGDMWLKRVERRELDGSKRRLKRLYQATGGHSYIDGNCFFHNGTTPLQCASASPSCGRTPQQQTTQSHCTPAARAHGGESMPRVRKHNTLLHDAPPPLLTSSSSIAGPRGGSSSTRCRRWNASHCWTRRCTSLWTV